MTLTTSVLLLRLRCDTLWDTRGDADQASPQVNADSNKTFTGGTKLETQDQELEDDRTGDEGRLRQ